jgi:serine/threonine-protein kinase ATR
MALLSADSSNITESTCLNLKCFCESFTGIFSDPDHLRDLPESNKPTDGVGIVINLVKLMIK